MFIWRHYHRQLDPSTPISGSKRSNTMAGSLVLQPLPASYLSQLVRHLCILLYPECLVSKLKAKTWSSQAKKQIVWSAQVTASKFKCIFVCFLQFRVVNNLVGARRLDNAFQHLILRSQRVHLKLKFFYLLFFFFNPIIGIGLGAWWSGMRQVCDNWRHQQQLSVPLALAQCHW